MPETLNISDDELNRLPFGIVKVDGSGRVLIYNRFESKMSGKSAEQVIGRNFFHEIAPCTAVKEFEGRFSARMVAGLLNEHFDFVFPFASGIRNVRIHMLNSPDGNAWIFVTDPTRNITVNQELARLRSERPPE